jgi:hypothetical protein
MRWAAVTLTLLCALPCRAAQPKGTFSLPLPSPELPDGVLTVKVVGADLRDLRVGQAVVLQRVAGQETRRWKEAATGVDGRARFEGLTAGERYVVTAAVDGGEHRSQQFPGPERGGIRLLLSLGGARMGAPQREQQGPLPEGHPTIPRRPREEGGPATVEPDRDLDAGRLRVIVLRGKARQPLGGARVELRLPDKQKPARSVVTNAKGEALMEVGAIKAKRFTLQVLHDKLTYRSGELERPAGHGLRATFVVFDRTQDGRHLALGSGTHWVCQVAEGVVRFMQVFHLVQQADQTFDPGAAGLELPLPAGARNLELPQELQGSVVYDEDNAALRLMVPVPPPGLELRWFYEIPTAESTGEVELRQRLPIPLGRSRLVVLDSGGLPLQLSGPSIAGDGQREQERRGMAFPLHPVRAGGSIEVTFAGLPHRDRRPLWAVLALAGLIALWGALGAIGGPRHVKEREAQRERLLKQLVQARRKQGKKQRERQEGLVQELKQLWDEPW